MQIHRAPNLSGIAHGFFGRDGGVSTGLYESLNCGLGSRDRPEAIVENRRRVAEAVAPGARLATVLQIHSPTVHVIDAGTEEARPEGDAMVTAQPGTALGILTADCAPVLFADRQAGVIGAAHAGWKGALGSEGRGVLEATIAAMEGLGAVRSRIAAAIGPCISQANYEVGHELRDRFLELGLRNRRFFVPSGREGHYRFDLEGYAANRLEGAGIVSVHRMGLCTYPLENRFFSFRRATHAGEADYGRELSVIMRPDEL